MRSFWALKWHWTGCPSVCCAEGSSDPELPAHLVLSWARTAFFLQSHSASPHSTATYLLWENSLTGLPTQSRPFKADIFWNRLVLVLEIWKHFLKSFFSSLLYFSKCNLFFHASLLLNRLSVGQWVSRLFAFPKIMPFPDCGPGDCGLSVQQQQLMGLLFLFLRLAVEGF